MKRVLSLLLVAAFAFCAPSRAEAAGLPKVGDKLHGFTVTERGTVSLVNAETVLFEHDKSGGQVLYIASEAIDRSFDISFRTPKLDSKGIPHVFEHACISGSESYPAQNLFFPMASQTYNTFVNAMTYDCMTSYPLSSLSEEQLLKITDYYLDGVFNPMLYDEERLYKREAWRYELADADAPLTVTGTVYNEMKGTQSIENAAYYNTLNALFPDSIISNVNGGDPDHITEMDWQELLDFHTKYYHPSNALVILYGDMDYEKFLELIGDDYFSNYDKAEIEIETGIIEPLESIVDGTYKFPVELSSQTQNASIVSYAGVANDATFEDSIGLAILMEILTHESSPLMQEMRATLPGSNVSASCSFLTTPVTYYSIQGNGLNEGDKETFNNIIDDAIALIAEEGVDDEIVDAILAAERFSNLTIPESANLGVNLSVSIALMWASHGNMNYFNDYLDAVDTIADKAYDGYFEGLIEKYLIDNNHKAILVTVPAPGESEAKAEALAAELEEIKAAMTDEEIEELVLATAELAEWSKEEAPAELIESFQVVSVKSLPEETAEYNITEDDRDGVHYMTAEAAVADIGRTVLYLNTSAVPEEDLHYLKLYSALIGQVGTENYTLAEIRTLMTRYLNGFSVSAGILDKEDGTYDPMLSAQWMSLNDEYEKCVELVKELMFKTDVTDIDMIKSVVGRLKSAKRSEINQAPYMYQYTRAAATGGEQYAYSEYLSGLNYYAFLIEAEVLLEGDPEEFSARLAAVTEKISVRDKANVLFAGNESGIDIFNENIDGLFEELSEGPIEEAGFLSGMLSAEREALIVDSSVQYNLLYATLESLGVEYSGKLQPMARLIYDAYITPQIRHGIGAYDNIVQFSEDGLVFISYRDPSLAETYQVYEGLSEFVENSGLTQEDVDRYILSVYSSYAAPKGELTGAINAMGLKLLGKPDDIVLQTMREIKSFTIEDLNEMAEAFVTLNEIGFRSTAGGAAVIEQNADLFERIEDISSWTANEAPADLTLSELAVQIFGGAEGAYELAVSSGIYTGDGFEGTDENTSVTREMLAVVLFSALGMTEADAETEAEAADFDEVSDWAKAAVAAMLALELMELDEDGGFNPQGGVTTADFETVLIKIMALSQPAA